MDRAAMWEIVAHSPASIFLLGSAIGSLMLARLRFDPSYDRDARRGWFVVAATYPIALVVTVATNGSDLTVVSGLIVGSVGCILVMRPRRGRS